MFRVAQPAVLVALVGTGCALSRAHERGVLSVTSQASAQDSVRRCDYGLEGALGVGAAVAVLKTLRGDPAEQLVYMVPISAGLGWLWGRFLMPPRPRCQLPEEDPERADSTLQPEMVEGGS
jgi:hypothetical protein